MILIDVIPNLILIMGQAIIEQCFVLFYSWKRLQCLVNKQNFFGFAVLPAEN